MTETVREATEHLAVACGIDVHVFEIEVKPRAETSAADGVPSPPAVGDTKPDCSLCDAALRGYPTSGIPGKTHRFAAYQAERLGGPYVYLCPLGLLHVAAAVVREERLAFALVAGPAVLEAIDDEVIAAAAAARPAALLSTDALTAWLHSVPRRSAGEARSLAHVIGRVSLSLCDNAGADYLRRAAEQSQTTETTDYLDYLATMGGTSASEKQQLIELDKRLTDCVAQGDRAGALAELEYVESGLRAFGSDVEAARSRVLELVVLLSRAAIAGGADVEQVFGLEYAFLARLRGLDSVDLIVSWFRRVMTRFTDLVFDFRHLRYSAHLAKVLRYLHDRFHDEVTLAGVAEAVGLSAGYLGRIFKSELHTSFKTYLARIRLQEAKRLLRNSTLPVGDVAARCGYPDHSYFTSVFKRATGKSPTEYRGGVGA